MNPSKIKDQYWVYTERKDSNYPKDTENSGKWLVFVPLLFLDITWENIKNATENGLLGSASKSATAKPNINAANSHEKVICVYTYDWTDKEDVMRVRDELRKLGVTWKIPYKSNNDTLEMKYQVNGDKKISKYYEQVINMDGYMGSVQITKKCNCDKSNWEIAEPIRNKKSALVHCNKCDSQWRI